MPLAPIETKVSASFNIAPSQDVLVLKPNPEMIKWSYSPKWKEDIKLINCRHETLLEKPSFKGSMRCVFVANGWIEWQRLKNEKKPFFHSIKTELIYFAGIYNLTSGCAVVTCQSSQHIAQVHHLLFRVVEIFPQSVSSQHFVKFQYQTEYAVVPSIVLLNYFGRFPFFCLS